MTRLRRSFTAEFKLKPHPWCSTKAIQSPKPAVHWMSAKPCCVDGFSNFNQNEVALHLLTGR